MNNTEKKNRYRGAEFLLSVANLRQLPVDEGFEVAFAGRSNVGKSSAINVLTGQTKLARTSKTPGRTQHLNFFRLDERRYLVDLPGYGYAKVPEAVKAQWQATLEDYLHQRQSLRGVVLLMDVRHPLTDFDWQMVKWCASVGMAVHIVLTKADKLKRGPAKATLLQVEREIRTQLGIEVTAQLFSSLKRDGVETLIQRLDDWFEWPT